MSLPAMREQLLARLLDSSVQEEWAREKAREMRLTIAGEKWTIALIRYNGGEVASRERELLPHMVRQRAEKELPRYCPVICFLYQDYVAVLATIEQQQDMLQLINGMRQICLSAQRFLQLELAVGIGSTCTALSQLRRSAMEARNALDYQTMVGEEPVVYIGDIEPQTTEASALEGYSFRELRRRCATFCLYCGPRKCAPDRRPQPDYSVGDHDEPVCRKRTDSGCRQGPPQGKVRIPIPPHLTGGCGIKPHPPVAFAWILL